MSHSIFDAIAKGDKDLCTQIIADDPSCLDALDAEGTTPLIRAGMDGKNEIVEAILGAGGDTILAVAARGDRDKAAEMLDADAGLTSQATADGFTALHVAALFGQERVIDVLLEYGSDIEAEATNSTKLQPIHCATISGVQPALDILLARGADPDTQDATGYTPLMIAAARGLERPLMTLIHYNCDVDFESDDGKTARDIATENGHERLVGLIPG